MLDQRERKVTVLVITKCRVEAENKHLRNTSAKPAANNAAAIQWPELLKYFRMKGDQARMPPPYPPPRAGEGRVGDAAPTRRMFKRRLLGHPPSATLDTSCLNPEFAEAARASARAVMRLRLRSSAKKPRPLRRIRVRKISLGSQCTSGNTVWNSTGNHRFGVVIKTARRATRQHSATNAHCRANDPTCSITAEE